MPLALSFIRTREYDKALNSLRELMRKRHRSWQLFYYSGLVHCELGNYKTAIQYLKCAKKLDGNHFEILKILDKAAFENYQFLKSLLYTIKLWIFAFMYFSKTLINIYSKRFLQIIFMSLLVNISVISIRLGRMLPFLMNKKGFARLDDMEQVKGEEMIDLGLYNQAIRLYKRANRKMPNRVDNFNKLAICYSYKGDYKKAISLLENAITVFPQDEILKHNLNLFRKKLVNN